MTISSQNRKAGPFIGNGSTSSFPFSFKVFTASDLYVVRTNTSSGVDTALTLNTDFTVSLNANQDASPGGTVTLTAGTLATGFNLTVTSQLQYLQPIDLTNQGGFYPSVITKALDRLTILTQQLLDSVTRSLKISVTTPAGVSTTLPPPVSNRLIGWSATGDSLVNTDPALLATIVAYGTAVPDVFTGNGVQTQFTLTANPANIGNLDIAVGGVTQIPNIDFTWTTGTTLTMTSPVPNGVKMLVRYMQGLPQGIAVPQDASVTTAKIVDANVTTAKIADGAITTAKIASNAVAPLAAGYLGSARSDVASAATVVLTSSPDDIRITGTTSITAFTIAAGRTVRITFAASLTLTNNANIVTQTSANIVTQAGDTCVIRATAANTVEVLCYARVAQPTLGTVQNTTSGTSIDFTSIPAWAKRVTVMFNGVSTNGTNIVQIQIGSGSPLTSGYLGGYVQATSATAATLAGLTTGFIVGTPTAANATFQGAVTISQLSASANTWVASGNIADSTNQRFWGSSGVASLSGALDRVRITTVGGTDTFDAGSVNILYEG